MIKNAILSLKYDKNFKTKRIYDFKLLPEQIEAIKKQKIILKKLKEISIQMHHIFYGMPNAVW